ncbi:MAG TPA: pyridoxal phosphate-dependent aminotransferase [Saprospiraceae bacterium]|nr:pyridoxal phosphate-dependent aminotransferase [Saprospiraceae bacterium]
MNPTLPIDENFIIHLLSKISFNNYCKPGGDTVLRGVIASIYRDSVFNSNIENAVITNGAIHGIDLVLRTRLIEGDEVLIPEPGFPAYASLVKLSKGVPVYYCVTINKNRASIDANEIRNKITRRTRIIIINSPHNPTCSVFTINEIMALVEILNDFPQLMYISDEVYSRLIFESTFSSLTSYCNSGVVVSSISKFYNVPGYRVGWIYGNLSIVENCMEVINFSAGSVSSIGQEVAKYLLCSNYDPMESYWQCRGMIKDVFDSLGIPYLNPEGTYFIFLRLTDSHSEIEAALLKTELEIIPGSIFGVKEPGSYRLSFNIPVTKLQGQLIKFREYLASL